jgi:hypothetical protein
MKEQTVKRLLVKFALIGALAGIGVAGFAAPAAAQNNDDTRASVSVGAAFLHWVDFEGFTTKGVAADFVKPIGKMPNWGVVGDVGFYHESDGLGENDMSFLGGVRYSYKAGRAVVFGQGLFGGVHWTDNDEGTGSGFAFVPGGGVVVMINDRFGVKGQVDYFVVQWSSNSFDDGNLVRYWFGVDIKLGKKK